MNFIFPTALVCITVQHCQVALRMKDGSSGRDLIVLHHLVFLAHEDGIGM